MSNMSAVVISKSPSVVVQPSEPVETGDIKLSSYDMIFGAVPLTSFYVFEHTIQEPVETIKRALSQALVHYYPIAGRLVAGANLGEFTIKCTGEGVHFVAASANCAIKDVQLSDPSLKEELAFFHEPFEGFSFSGPLVVMQVTVFSCGGFVVGLTWSHVVGDGRGGAQFLQAVGELARGLPTATPSILPLRSADALVSGLGLPPSTINFLHVMGSLPQFPTATLDITVPSTLIDRIKGKYSSMNHEGRPCSVFEAVAAVLWQCRTRAIGSDPDSLAVLSYPADAREYAGAKEGYYGNCISLEVVTATSGAVANADVMDLVEMIRLAKGRVPEQADMDQLWQLQAYNLLLVSSWRNLGLDAPDFGAGRPARVMTHLKEKNSVPFCTACIPCKEEHSVLCRFVTEEHAGAFLRELAHMNDTLYA